ncbi:hypothetical protein ALT721_1190028 [Alteromonas alvinellae]
MLVFDVRSLIALMAIQMTLGLQSRALKIIKPFRANQPMVRM